MRDMAREDSIAVEIGESLCYAAVGNTNLTKFRKNLIKVIPAPRAIGIHPNPSPTRGHELTDEENRAL